MVLDRCWSGRKTQNDLAAAVLDRPSNLPDFRRLVWMVGDAVNLQEIDTPPSKLPQKRVVPGLTGLVVFDSPTRRVPWTGIILVRCILSFEIRSLDGRIVRNAFTRNPANDVNAEFQSLRVDGIGELLETSVLAVLERRWKACRNGNESTIFVERIFK